MTILALIKSLLSAIAALAEAYTANLRYEILRESELRQGRLRDQIESYRQQGTTEATENADFLFTIYQKEKKKYEKFLDS